MYYENFRTLLTPKHARMKICHLVLPTLLYKPETWAIRDNISGNEIVRITAKYTYMMMMIIIMYVYFFSLTYFNNQAF